MQIQAQYSFVNLYERQKYLTQLFENYHNYTDSRTSYLPEDINVIQSAINSGYTHNLITKLISRTKNTLNSALPKLNVTRKNHQKFNSVSIVKSKDGYLRTIPTPVEHQPIKIPCGKILSFDYSVYFLNVISPKDNYLILARKFNTNQVKILALKQMLKQNTVPEHIKPFVNNPYYQSETPTN